MTTPVAPTAALELHAHLLPPERNAGLMRWMHRAMPDCPVPIDITADQALLDLREAGAGAIVNLLFPLGPGEADGLHEWGAELSRRVPEVIPIAGVHAEDEDPERVVRRALEELGLRGLKLHPMVQRFTPDDPRLRGALAALAEHGLPLYVHTGFEEFYGWGYDVGELEAIAERHPEIPLVLAHSNYPHVEWAAEMARRHPQVWLETTNAWALSLGEPDRRAALMGLVEAAPDRVVFGTDYPATMMRLEDLHATAPDDAAAVMAANAPALLALMRG